MLLTYEYIMQNNNNNNFRRRLFSGFLFFRGCFLLFTMHLNKSFLNFNERFFSILMYKKVNSKTIKEK